MKNLIIILALFFFLIFTSCNNEGMSGHRKPKIATAEMPAAKPASVKSPMDSLWEINIKEIDETVDWYTNKTHETADYTSTDESDKTYSLIRLCKSYGEVNSLGQTLIIEKWAKWSQGIGKKNEGVGYLLRKDTNGFWLETSKTVNDQYVDSTKIKIIDLIQLKEAFSPFKERQRQVKNLTPLYLQEVEKAKKRG